MDGAADRQQPEAQVKAEAASLMFSPKIAFCKAAMAAPDRTTASSDFRHPAVVTSCTAFKQGV